VLYPTYNLGQPKNIQTRKKHNHCPKISHEQLNSNNDNNKNNNNNNNNNYNNNDNK